MSAPDYEQLYDFESNIELGIKAILEMPLADGGFDLRVYRQTDGDTVQHPYVAIQLVLGSALDHPIETPGGGKRNDVWESTLKTQIVTERIRTTNQHSLYRQRCRKAFYAFRTTFTEEALPYYQVLNMFESGSTPTVRGDNNEDISDLNWYLRFAIRPRAWPQ